MPCTRDRSPRPTGANSLPLRIAAPYLQWTRSQEWLLPWLYLKGISTVAFEEALRALLDEAAPGPAGPYHQPPEGPLGAGLRVVALARLERQALRVLVSCSTTIGIYVQEF